MAARDRQAAAERARLAPRLWVLSLLWRHRTTLDMLNRQLVHAPDGQPYVPGEHPAPFPVDTDAKPTFDRHLELGTRPNGCYHHDGHGAYNLFERVQSHDRESGAWLLEPLAPYFRAEVPPIDHAVDSLAACLGTLGLRRLSWSTAWFGARRYGESYWLLAQHQLEYFATLPTPSHLVLLITLWHQQLWAIPFSAPWHARYCQMLSEAFDAAVDGLTRHPMLETHPVGERMPDAIRTAFAHVHSELNYFGARSRVSPSKTPEPELAPPLFIEDFEGFDDADFCAGLGAAVPIEQVEGIHPPRLTRYSDKAEPPLEASTRAFNNLLHRVDGVDVFDRTGANENCATTEHVWRRFLTRL